jgi:hypothetical protein
MGCERRSSAICLESLSHDDKGRIAQVREVGNKGHHAAPRHFRDAPFGQPEETDVQIVEVNSKKLRLLNELYQIWKKRAGEHTAFCACVDADGIGGPQKCNCRLGELQKIHEELEELDRAQDQG